MKYNKIVFSPLELASKHSGETYSLRGHVCVVESHTFGYITDPICVNWILFPGNVNFGGGRREAVSFETGVTLMAIL